MNPQQMLEWMQLHSGNIHHVLPESDKTLPYRLEWTNLKHGHRIQVTGLNIVDCIAGAVLSEAEWLNEA